MYLDLRRGYDTNFSLVYEKNYLVRHQYVFENFFRELLKFLIQSFLIFFNQPFNVYADFFRPRKMKF